MSENVPPQPPDPLDPPDGPDPAGEPELPQGPAELPSAADPEPMHVPPTDDAPPVDPGDALSAADEAAPPWAPPRHPIHLVVTDDLHRSRLTVLLRGFLAIPHLIWVTLWGVLVFFFVIAAWFVALVTGRVPLGIHMFIAQYLRYATQVYAYISLAANPFPAFDGKTPYPVDLEIALPQPQNRLTVLFRIILMIPIYIVVSIVVYFFFLGVALAWLIALVLGRLPQGFERFLTWYIGLNARFYGYLYLLTGKYPSID